MRLIPYLALALGGCGADADPKFERFAMKLGPDLAQLKEPAKVVLQQMGADAAAVRAVVEACTSVDPVLERISRAQQEAADTTGIAPPVPKLASIILDDRGLYCGSDDHDRCARWCVVSWTRLVLGVEKLRVDAARHGVTLVSLSPVAE